MEKQVFIISQKLEAWTVIGTKNIHFSDVPIDNFHNTGQNHQSCGLKYCMKHHNYVTRIQI